MHLETWCGIIDPKYIGIFCVDWVTVKWYDVYRLDAWWTQTLIRTDYFNIVDNSIVVPVTAPTEWACPIAWSAKYDYEKELLCEKLTGRKVLIESRVDVLDPTQTRQWRITYLVWWAVFAWDPELDLENCPDTDVESDPQIMCDNGTTFMRWYEKSNGVPTVNFYDRTLDYAVYVPVGPVTPWACTTGKIADVPNCAWTTDPKPIDIITATYLLNQENKHTERLYDNVTATLTGTIGLLITGTNVAIDFSWIVATNRVWANYILEAGTWFSDVGWNPTRDYIDEPDGNYEVKIYRTFVYPEGRRDYLISAIEVIKTGSTLTVQWTNPVALNRSITYTAKEVLQDYCNNLPVWVPYLTDGTAATIIWTLSLSYREEQTERLWISDANNDEAQVSIERLDMVDFIDPTNAVHFTRIVERTNWAVTATYDIDNTGAIYTPTGVVLSKEKDQEYKSTCYRALVNGAWFTAGDVLEFNVVFDPRNPLSPHYINRTNRNTLWNVFEQSPAGVSWTFPTVGTEVIPCEQYVECKKEIIAVEPKFYVTEVPSAPVWYTGYDFDLPTDYATTDATDTYFHILYLSNAYYYPPAVTNPTTPILIDGNVTAINNFIQSSLIADGQVGDEFYIVVNTDKTITVRAKNTYTPTGDEFRLWLSTPDQYTNKYFPVIPTTHITTTTSCIDIQEVKEKDTCTGLETYRYVIEDGAGNLVDASTFIAGRDEANVASSCPETPVVAVVEIPWWVLLPTGNTFNTFPANVVSFTVSAQSGSFDISFDSWTTFLTARKWTRTRWQGTIETIDVSQVVVVSNWDVDIIRETI